MTSNAGWTTVAVEVVETTCVSTLVRDESLLDIGINGQLQLPKIFDDLTCPGHCTNHGVCSKGKWHHLQLFCLLILSVLSTLRPSFKNHLFQSFLFI